MLKLLKIEYRKAISYSFAAVVFIIYFVSFTAFMAILAEGDIQFGNFTSSQLFNLPNVWGYLAYIASFANWWFAIFIINNVCNEFQFRTFRQHIVDGLARNELLLSKVLLVVMVCLLNVVYLCLAGTIFSAIYAQLFSFEGLFEQFYYLALLFVNSFCYLTIAVIFALQFRKTAPTIILMVAYIFLFENILGYIIGDVAKDYLPFKMIGNILPFPMVKSPNKWLMASLVSLGYTILALTGGWAILKFRDLRS